MIGRDALIAKLWGILDERSVILSAERRVGKTYVIQKMDAEPPEGVLTFYQDMEDVHTVQDFCDKLYQEIKHKLGWVQKATRGAADFSNRLEGGGIKLALSLVGVSDAEATLEKLRLSNPPWDIEIAAFITYVAASQPKKVVFFWDEVPWMIHNITKTEGADTARRLLELLRALRHTPDIQRKLRMVYTGSIGFHHVMAAPPINDMRPDVPVPPLAADDAYEYARRRLESKGAKLDDPQETIQAIASAANHVPYYIRNLVDGLCNKQERISTSDVENFIAHLLVQTPEKWDLPHYDHRIDEYYAEKQRGIARDLLDIIAFAEQPLEFDQVFNLLKARRRVADRDFVHSILHLLRQDHSIWAKPYRFQSQLVRRFWREWRNQ